MILSSLAQWVAWDWHFGSSFASAYTGLSEQCRCLPHDACWPSQNTWSAFNTSISGRLVKTVPLASPCHDPHFDNATCTVLRTNWTEPSEHTGSSSSIMAPFFANRSCDPFTSAYSPCRLGNYVAYAVNVSSVRDVQSAIAFAEQQNIRLVIRNTGHDYNGKSTGAGALAIWTHYLKDIELLGNYSDPYYSGPAMKVGAGVQFFEAYAAADKVGLRVVGGSCPTVGVAGGYTQGGGHSPLASRHGLAADQALEWKVVDGNGRLLTASRTQNPELFWALSGGGGGTFGVVVSLILKAHTDGPVSAFSLSFSAEGVEKEDYYDAISVYHGLLPDLVDRGITCTWFFSNESFMIAPIVAPDVPVKELGTVLQPFLDRLGELDIKYNSVLKQFSGYLEEFQNMSVPIPVGVAQYGGWLVPRSVVENKNAELTQAYREIVEDGATFIGVGLNVSRTAARGTANVRNSVLPAWRDTLIDTVLTTAWNFTAPWSEMIENQRKMTQKYIPKLAALAPDSGAYMNEGDFMQPGWQKVFYGGNYEGLLRVKREVDPEGMFWADRGVGSEGWSVGEGGRMCRV